MKKLFASLALVAVITPVRAVTRPAALSISGMTCSACPIIVEKAISEVDDVNKIAVIFETCKAVVTFDDARTSMRELTEVAGDAGYPSNVKQ